MTAGAVATDDRGTGVAEVGGELGIFAGHSRYRDPITEQLGAIASMFDTLSAARQAQGGIARNAAPGVRGLGASIHDALGKQRNRASYKLNTLLIKHHVMGSWFADTIGGTHVARLVSMIGDPLRFPGRRCAEGHYMPKDWHGPCGEWIEDGDGVAPCGAAVGDVRRGSGVRSMWHYCGLHVVDGNLARRKRGVQCSWNTAARTAILMPLGIADQLISKRIEPYRGIYDTTKQRIQGEAGGECTAESGIEGEKPASPDVSAGGAGQATEIVKPCGSFRSPHRIARIVAAKAFVGDMLIEWKRRSSAETHRAFDMLAGEAAS